MAYVYRHIRLDKNVPFYIGISNDVGYKRAYNKTYRNKYWKNIANITEYDVDIIIDSISWDNACLKEIEFIKLYGRYPNGPLCNMTDGGDGITGLKRNKEFCKRNSDIHKGKILNNDTRIKISKSHLGKILSIEHKNNISKAVKGRVLSDIHKERIGASNKLENNGNWNGYIIQYDINNNFVCKYNTLHHAMNMTNIDYRDISKVCSYYNHIENNGDYNYKKKHKTAGGYIWKREH